MSKSKCKICNQGAAILVDQLVKNLCSAEEMPLGRYEKHQRKACEISLPSRQAIIQAVDTIRGAIFPGYTGINDISTTSATYYIGAALDQARRLLSEQIKRGLCFSCPPDGDCKNCEILSLKITNDFLAQLPALQAVLYADVQAAYNGDPAAPSLDEVIFCYPGTLAISYYRIAHALHVMDVPLLPRIITEYAHSLTGVDIHPGATIGEGFFIDHGTGVVIGETSIIGKNVRLYQGVTLGAKSFPLDAEGKPIKGIPRHPIVEDNVIIYAGATILGRITIGRNSTIGGNVWLTESVPANSLVVQPAANCKITTQTQSNN